MARKGSLGRALRANGPLGDDRIMLAAFYEL